MGHGAGRYRRKKMYFNSLWNEFSRVPEVEAIALGGSRAGMNFDEKSDSDKAMQTLVMMIGELERTLQENSGKP